MKKNVGTFDAIMRISMGLTGIAWGISRMVRHPNRGTPLLITMLSSIKVAEGITRSCLIFNLFGITTIQENDQKEKRLPVDQAGTEYQMEH